MSKPDFPEQCSTCRHYDNMEGVCYLITPKKDKPMVVDYVCHCKHYELAEELKR